MNFINKLIYKIKWNLFDNIEDINQIEFNLKQKEQIFLREKKGLDVSIYSKPEFTWDQMQEIRFGLESGLDVTIYANPNYNSNQMNQIFKGLKKGIDVSLYLNLTNFKCLKFYWA